MNVLALPSTRRNASQRRRAPQIIDAAARVFAERGFHGATTQDIAGEFARLVIDGMGKHPAVRRKRR